MNWGWKIAIVYSLFVVFMMSMFFLASSFKRHLVTDTYYEEALDYDEHKEKLSNSYMLNGDFSFRKDDNALIVSFPDDHKNAAIVGSIILYRPSDGAQDQVYTINAKNNEQFIPITGLMPGRWRIKIDWACNGKSFYHEQKISL